MPRPCPKRVHQLKQHTPNCKAIFPVYFFLRRPSWYLDRIMFHCKERRRKRPSWYLDRIMFHCNERRRKPAKEKINRKNCFAIWCQTRHAGASTCHVPASQCSCSCGPASGKFVTQEPPLVMFLRHNGHVPAAQSLANSPRRNPHPL